MTYVRTSLLLCACLALLRSQALADDARVIAGSGVSAVTKFSRKHVTASDVSLEGTSLDGTSLDESAPSVENDVESWSAPDAPAMGIKPWGFEGTISPDQTLAGRVLGTIGGRPVSGSIRGRVEGRHVWGDVLDESGKQLGTFRGTLGPDGILGGGFTTRDDDEGVWSWTAPLPE